MARHVTCTTCKTPSVVVSDEGRVDTCPRDECQAAGGVMIGRVVAAGDTVRVGKGDTIWEIESLWVSAGGGHLVQLVRDGGTPGVEWIRTSVSVDRLSLAFR